MTLERPADWPASLSPPLVLAQAEEVRRCLAATHEEVAVVVRCRRCGTFVGAVRNLTRVDGGQAFHLSIGSVYRGTVRATDRRLEVAKSHRNDRRYVPLDDQYLACLETASAGLLPLSLPAWCDRHGHFTVPLRALQVAVATWRRDEPERPLVVEAAAPLHRPPLRYAHGRQSVDRWRQAPEERP